MKKSAFNIESQQKSLTSKVVVGLERISEVFKSLLWEQAKATGLSPIQIQILVFLTYHKSNLCKVSYLAHEFNVTKPTISDAVRVLLLKGLVEKKDAGGDSRSYILGLTKVGNQLIADIEQFAAPVDQEVAKLDNNQLTTVYQTLTELIYQLNQSGVLSVQRTCYLCSFYEKKSAGHYCHFLEQKLSDTEIRIDCPEYESKSN
ncbi:MAG: MarR family winged helix-turn-helix transcriptional regulator [Reichenbachiella sp.]|uniref:MarR family winged helix-turn-helix transcriptional regulator n=1 Tax=Reichenbachiella sp. TaxID=2184521 RepID=UPI003265EA70